MASINEPIPPADDDRPVWSVSWDEGYQAGKRAATADAYAKGYQDAFNEIGGRIEALFVCWANEPIPAQSDGKVSP